MSKPQCDRVRAHYVGLRLISGVLRLVGWLSILLSILVFAVAAGGADRLGLHVGNLNDQIRPLFTSIGLLMSFSFFTWGLFTLAFGELLKVLVDIAFNTAILPNIAEDTNYFYERLSPQQ